MHLLAITAVALSDLQWFYDVLLIVILLTFMSWQYIKANKAAKVYIWKDSDQWVSIHGEYEQSLTMSPNFFCINWLVILSLTTDQGKRQTLGLPCDARV